MRRVKGNEPGDRRAPWTRPLFQFFAAASFQSLWYWVLHVVVWTLACYRTLGVPHDMLLAGAPAAGGRRAGRRARAPRLRRGSAASTTRSGCRSPRWPASFSPAVFALGFLSGIETAQAAFAILLPLAVIVYSKLRLALAVRRKRMAGPELVLALARRRIWHQFIAVAAMLAAGGGGDDAASADPAAIRLCDCRVNR